MLYGLPGQEQVQHSKQHDGAHMLEGLFELNIVAAFQDVLIRAYEKCGGNLAKHKHDQFVPIHPVAVDSRRETECIGCPESNLHGDQVQQQKIPVS